MRTELRPGTAVGYEGDDYDVEALEGTLVRLRRRGPERSAVVVAVECLLVAPGYRILDVKLPTGAVAGDPAAELLPDAHRATAEARLANVLEARTGYRSGHAADPFPGEPRPGYDPSATIMSERFATKAAELTAAGEKVSQRTLHRWWARWQELGLTGLVDARLTAQRKVLPSVDPRVRAEAERLVRSRSDGPTAAPSQLARHLRVAVEDAHGPDVRLPSRSVTQRLLHEVARGHATFSSGKRRREAANEPSTPFGSLRASRPGQLVQYDSSPVNAFAYDPHTLEYQALDLSVGLDVFSSSCVALRYTPIHAKAVDAVLLLRDTVTPKPARPGWPAEALWRYPGIPEAVLVSCLTGESHPKAIAGIPMVRPQAAVCDNGMIYLSLAFREGCATLGIDLQLARQGTPTDKPHVERFFATYESTFACDLPGAKGRDVAGRGKRPEDEAVYFVSEIEDLTYEWLALHYQRAPSEGNRLACDPRRDLSPNEIFDEGVARAGFVHVPPMADLYYTLLPRRARKVSQRGVKLFGLWFDGPALEPYRPKVARAERPRDDRHLIRFDPRDLRHVWFRHPDTGEFASLDWRGLETAATPFGDLELAWCKANLLADSGLRASEAELEEVLCRFLRRYAADAPAKRAEIKLRKAAVLHQASAAKDRGTSKLLAPDVADDADWDADTDDIEPMPLFSADQPV